MSIRLRLYVRSRLRGFCSAGGLSLVELGAASACMFLNVTAAHAAGSGMPWEAPLERVLESVQGPVAKIVAVIIITVTGISLAFGDTSGGFRKMVQVVFGLSIAFAASSFFLSFFSFGGGALI
nr:TrbC/VirB2 family protein [Bradyrhizobium liaoningense]